jgi:hypothetical protein
MKWADGRVSSWKSKVGATVAQGVKRLDDELSRLDARNVVISTNLRVRLDSLPASGQREPDDPGVAVYFTLDGKRRCLPCDRWDRVADNMIAIAKFIDAMRGQLRWGVGDVGAIFEGFKALPPAEAAMTAESAAAFVGLRRGYAASAILASESNYRDA